MPVFVTRADVGIGPALVAALSGDDADVRAFATGNGEVTALRSSGAFVTVGDLDDEGHLDAAMTDVHTVIVPTATWLADVETLVDEVATIVRAAGLAEVPRVVLVSVVGADPDVTATIPAAFGHAERHLASAAMQTLVVRTDGIVEHGFRDLAGALDCPVEVAPVPAARLVEGLVALDAARSGQAGGHAVFTALGEVRSLPTPGAGHPVDASGGTGRRADDGPGRPAAANLVGRRWLAPDRRDTLREALCGRGRPEVEGADLWAFTEVGS